MTALFHRLKNAFQSGLLIGSLMLGSSAFSAPLNFKTTTQTVETDSPEISATFNFSNSNATPVIIQVATSTNYHCKVDFPKQPILPKWVGTIVVTCTNIGRGVFNSTINVQTNEGTNTLTVKTVVPSQACVADFKSKKFDNAIKALNKISKGAHVACAPQPDESEDAKLTRVSKIVALEKEKEALTSYIFMSYLYGKLHNQPLDAGATPAITDEACKLMRNTTSDEVDIIRATHAKGSDQLDKTGIAMKSNCQGNPEVTKRIKEATQLAQAQLKNIGYTSKTQGDLHHFNTAVAHLHQACSSIHAREVSRQADLKRINDRMMKENGSDPSRGAYDDWHRMEGMAKEDDAKDFPQAEEALQEVFGSYYGRLVTASPELMKKIGLNPEIPLSSPQICRSIGSLPESNGISSAEFISPNDISAAMGDQNAKKNEERPSFVDAVRSQLSEIAGERIPELAPFNKPEKLREKVAYEFLLSHKSSALQEAIRNDPSLVGPICNALSKQSFWENDGVKQAIKVGKMVGTAFAMVGGIALAPFTAGSSIAGALLLVSTLAVNEAIYYAGDHEMRTQQAAGKNQVATQVRSISSANTDELIQNAGGIQAGQKSVKDLESERDKAASDQWKNRIAVVASFAGGAVLSRAMSSAAEALGVESAIGRGLAKGLQVEVQGVKMGVADVADQLINYGVTGQFNAEGFVLGKFGHHVNEKVISMKTISALMREEKFVGFKEGDTPTREQKIKLAQDLRKSMKEKGVPEKDLPSNAALLGKIDQVLLDATPEKVNGWLSEVRNSGDQKKIDALSALEQALKDTKPPLSNEKISELLTNAYVAHMSGKSAVGVPNTPGYVPADKTKMQALALFAIQLDAAGIPPEVLGKGGKGKPGLVKKLADANLLGAPEYSTEHLAQEHANKQYKNDDPLDKKYLTNGKPDPAKFNSAIEEYETLNAKLSTYEGKGELGEKDSKARGNIASDKRALEKYLQGVYGKQFKEYQTEFENKKTQNTAPAGALTVTAAVSAIDLKPPPTDFNANKTLDNQQTFDKPGQYEPLSKSADQLIADHKNTRDPLLIDQGNKEIQKSIDEISAAEKNLKQRIKEYDDMATYNLGDQNNLKVKELKALRDQREKLMLELKDKRIALENEQKRLLVEKEKWKVEFEKAPETYVNQLGKGTDDQLIHALNVSPMPSHQLLQSTESYIAKGNSTSSRSQDVAVTLQDAFAKSKANLKDYPAIQQLLEKNLDKKSYAKMVEESNHAALERDVASVIGKPKLTEAQSKAIKLASAKSDPEVQAAYLADGKFKPAEIVRIQNEIKLSKVTPEEVTGYFSNLKDGEKYQQKSAWKRFNDAPEVKNLPPDEYKALTRDLFKAHSTGEFNAEGKPMKSKLEAIALAEDRLTARLEKNGMNAKDAAAKAHALVKDLADQHVLGELPSEYPATKYSSTDMGPFAYKYKDPDNIRIERYAAANNEYYALEKQKLELRLNPPEGMSRDQLATTLTNIEKDQRTLKNFIDEKTSSSDPEFKAYQATKAKHTSELVPLQNQVESKSLFDRLVRADTNDTDRIRAIENMVLKMGKHEFTYDMTSKDIIKMVDATSTPGMEAYINSKSRILGGSIRDDISIILSRNIEKLKQMGPEDQKKVRSYLFRILPDEAERSKFLNRIGWGSEPSAPVIKVISSDEASGYLNQASKKVSSGGLSDAEIAKSWEMLHGGLSSAPNPYVRDDLLKKGNAVFGYMTSEQLKVLNKPEVMNQYWDLIASGKVNFSDVHDQMRYVFNNGSSKYKMQPDLDHLAQMYQKFQDTPHKQTEGDIRKLFESFGYKVSDENSRSRKIYDQNGNEIPGLEKRLKELRGGPQTGKDPAKPATILTDGGFGVSEGDKKPVERQKIDPAPSLQFSIGEKITGVDHHGHPYSGSVTSIKEGKATVLHNNSEGKIALETFELNTIRKNVSWIPTTVPEALQFREAYEKGALNDQTRYISFLKPDGTRIYGRVSEISSPNYILVNGIDPKTNSVKQYWLRTTEAQSEIHVSGEAKVAFDKMNAPSEGTKKALQEDHRGVTISGYAEGKIWVVFEDGERKLMPKSWYDELPNHHTQEELVQKKNQDFQRKLSDQKLVGKDEYVGYFENGNFMHGRVVGYVEKEGHILPRIVTEDNTLTVLTPEQVQKTIIRDPKKIGRTAEIQLQSHLPQKKMLTPLEQSILKNDEEGSVLVNEMRQTNLIGFPSTTPGAAVARNDHIVKRMKELPVTGASNKIKGLSESQSQKLFDKVSTNPISGPEQRPKYDPTGTTGFCFGRAMVAHMDALKSGVAKDGIMKVFAVGNLKSAEGNWDFHVATLVRRDNGSWWAIDPIMGKPLDIQDWYTAMKGYDYDGKMRLMVTPASRFTPKKHYQYAKEAMGGDTNGAYFKDLLQYYRDEVAQGKGLDLNSP